MDTRNLKMLKNDESFDVAFDKGTMNASMYNEGDIWNTKSEEPEVIEKKWLGGIEVGNI